MSRVYCDHAKSNPFEIERKRTNMQSLFRRVLNPGRYTTSINISLLILRIAGGGFMLAHGFPKLMKLLGDDPIKFADPIGLGVTGTLVLAVFTEVFCSIVVVLGLATRVASALLLATMLIAALIVHANDGFGKQELPLLYSAVYLVLMMVGSGRLSIDGLLVKGR